MMVGAVRRVAIDSLSPDIDNAMVIGVVIAKQSPKRIVSKIDGLERGVWNFTLRDSPHDTINVCCWSSWDKTTALSNISTIGDVVEVINPKISFVSGFNSGLQYRVAVSSPFQLELQESRNSELVPHLEQDTRVIRELMKIPTKPEGSFLRLSDVCGNAGKAMQGQVVNLLVVVTHVSHVRTVMRKASNESIPCRDLVVMDETERYFQITIWDLDILHLADSWKSMETILFLADVLITYDHFKQSVTAKFTGRTVVTVDPETPEANKLRAYAVTIPAEPSALLDQISDDFDTGRDFSTEMIMTTAQVLDKAFSNDVPGGQFSALLYAHITQFDLDGYDGIFKFKCSACGVENKDQICVSKECASVLSNLLPVYSIRVCVSDHRGSFDCSLKGTRAAAVIGCTEEAFLELSFDERTQLKWRILLQRCAVRVMVLCNRFKPMISVLSCEPVDTAEVSAKLPFY